MANQEKNLYPKTCFVSRDLSWLEFNKRVLSIASDKKVPLVERLKFLGIYHSNLDEFFMARVGSLKHRALYMPGYKDIKTGRTAEEELKKIYTEISEQQKEVRDVYEEILEDFKEHSIEKVNFAHLSKSDETMVKKMFTEYKDFLAPRIVDEQHPMPFLTGGESFVAVVLQKNARTKLGIVSLYRVPKYRTFVSPSGKQKVVVISELVAYYAQTLFKGQSLKEKVIIRLTRNADVFFESYESGEGEDSRFDMKKLLKKRKRQLPVRLQICGKPSYEFVELLRTNFDLALREIYTSKVPFDINFASCLEDVSDLKYPSRKPAKNVLLKKGEFFKYIEKQDLLLSFPYQSINPFVDLLYEAADDPDVISINITLYRLAGSSRLAAALAYAADRGKHVLCLLELRARFDEQNNIDYSEVLEDAGCSIIYGLPDMKVHSKLCLITRKASSGVKYITQIGTGNYNEVTSEQYSDLSIITADQTVGQEANEVFKALSLGEVPPKGTKLITAPKGFKEELLSLMDRELAKGIDGRIAMKVNSINDIDIMNKLIDCSKAGVQTELFVRGICCLKPGIANFTDNIRVKSIIGRYLEHSRIYVFGTGKDMKVLVGSGDLLNRNTTRRVEAFIDVTNSNVLKDVLEVMDAFRDDVDNSWYMQADGTYLKMPRATGKDNFNRLYKHFAEDTRVKPVRKGLFRR